MKNILIMEFYRLRKSLAFYIIILIIMFLGFLSPIIATSSQETTSVNIEQGISIIENDYSKVTIKETKLENILHLFLDGNILIMIVIIFTSLFAGAYFKANYEKNIVGALGKRFRLPLATFSMLVISIIVFLLVALISTFLGEYFTNYTSFSSMPLGDIYKFTMFIFTYFILLVGISSFVLMLLQVFRNQLLVLILGLIYGSGLVFSIFNIIIFYINQKIIFSESYILLGMALNLSTRQNAFTKEIIAACFTTIIMLLLTSNIKQKQDIRSF